MFSIIGIVLVFAAIVGGYLMEKGNLLVLLQPAELIIIAGAAAGTVLIANPLYILKQIVQGFVGVFKGSRFTRQLYLDSLKMLFDLFNRSRREGLTAIEADLEEPEKSKTFSAFPSVIEDHHVRGFICDTLRMASTGAVEPFDIDQMMELDMDVHHRDATLPVSALSTVADALPGLGIVAAVLGVVITMGALGGPPEESGDNGGVRGGRPKRSGPRGRAPWWAHFWASFCFTALWDRSRPTCPKPWMKRALITRFCAWPWHLSSRARRLFWRSRLAGAALRGRRSEERRVGKEGRSRWS